MSEYRKLRVNVGSQRDAVGTSGDDTIRELNQLGREGWEVVRIIPLVESCGPAHTVIFVLRRNRFRPTTTAGAMAAYVGL
jgi:hypothetical protein